MPACIATDDVLHRLAAVDRDLHAPPQPRHVVGFRRRLRRHLHRAVDADHHRLRRRGDRVRVQRVLPRRDVAQRELAFGSRARRRQALSGENRRVGRRERNHDAAGRRRAQHRALNVSGAVVEHGNVDAASLFARVHGHRRRGDGRRRARVVGRRVSCRPGVAGRGSRDRHVDRRRLTRARGLHQRRGDRALDRGRVRERSIHRELAGTLRRGHQILAGLQAEHAVHAAIVRVGEAVRLEALEPRHHRVAHGAHLRVHQRLAVLPDHDARDHAAAQQGHPHGQLLSVSQSDHRAGPVRLLLPVARLEVLVARDVDRVLAGRQLRKRKLALRIGDDDAPDGDAARGLRHAVDDGDRTAATEARAAAGVRVGASSAVGHRGSARQVHPRAAERTARIGGHHRAGNLAGPERNLPHAALVRIARRALEAASGKPPGAEAADRRNLSRHGRREGDGSRQNERRQGVAGHGWVLGVAVRGHFDTGSRQPVGRPHAGPAITVQGKKNAGVRNASFVPSQRRARPAGARAAPERCRPAAGRRRLPDGRRVARAVQAAVDPRPPRAQSDGPRVVRAGARGARGRAGPASLDARGGQSLMDRAAAGARQPGGPRRIARAAPADPRGLARRRRVLRQARSRSRVRPADRSVGQSRGRDRLAADGRRGARDRAARRGGRRRARRAGHPAAAGEDAATAAGSEGELVDEDVQEESYRRIDGTAGTTII